MSFPISGVVYILFQSILVNHFADFQSVLMYKSSDFWGLTFSTHTSHYPSTNNNYNCQQAINNKLNSCHTLMTLLFLSTHSKHLRSLRVTYLLLHLSKTFPVRIWPCFTSTGVCIRHLTWYQWVNVSVGLVDNQTGVL